MSIRINVVGVQDLTTKLNRLPDNVRREMESGMREVGKMVSDRAKDLCEVDIGRLRNSIAPSFGGNQYGHWVTVGTDVEYAAFVEFGTGPRGSTTNDNPTPSGYQYHAGNGGLPPLEIIAAWCVRKGIDPKLAYPIARKIAREGLPARSFLYRAYRDTFDEATKTLIEAGKRGLGE